MYILKLLLFLLATGQIWEHKVLLRVPSKNAAYNMNYICHKIFTINYYVMYVIQQTNVKMTARKYA